ncbi:glutamyl-tRNA reductase [Pyxidicoccus xibeiensis]|uniref:glutamyl-tRNA reductase n=1 Tax=Pyxidicoccus xibeiensis TaxID=2906759 RepID=UPI002B211F2E|nr:glutamyl-tRNA reductase [Pyxidicoccus xibeiensis]
MALVCVGLSHQTAPLAVRERLAMSEARRLELLGRWGRAPDEAMIVATCNRVEVYVATQDAAGARARVREELERMGGPELQGYLYEYEGTGALEHLFRVACSLDSLVLGESQILGQVKTSFEAARRAGAARGRLARACAAAFSCAKRVRTGTAIGRAPTSMASASVALVSRELGDLSDKTVLMVGAGEMGRLAARHLGQARVGRLLVTNRTRARAELLAAEVGGEARPFEALHALLEEADVVVCSTTSPVPLFTRRSMGAVGPARRFRPLLMVDLAVPRDIAPDVSELGWVSTHDVDDLQRFVARSAAARAEAARAAGVLVRQEVGRFMRAEAERDGPRMLVELRRRAGHIARAEVERTLATLGPDLTDRQRQSVEALARAIVNKLLHAPTSCLRREAHGADGQALSEAAARLFGLGAG